MTYEEWAATVWRGVTINPQMAFAAGAASRDAEIAELKDALGYDWDKYKASQMALRECMQMVVEQDAEIAELVEALLEISQVACSLSPEQKIANEALAKVRKP